MSLDEVRGVRLEKLEKLKEYGMDPYPARVARTFCLGDFGKNFKSLAENFSGFHFARFPLPFNKLHHRHAIPAAQRAQSSSKGSG